jgi:vacuolar-type H+-ATPase subunit I/STV1
MVHRISKRGNSMGREIWMQWFIWVFFLYGLFEFICMLFYRSPWYKRKESNRLILVIHNGEDYIEGLLRTLASQGFQIDIVDEKSTDATRGIVEKLSHDQENIHLIEGHFGKVEGEIF